MRNPYSPATLPSSESARESTPVDVARRAKIGFLVGALPLVVVGALRVISYWIFVLRTPNEFHGGTAALLGFFLIAVGLVLGLVTAAVAAMAGWIQNLLRDKKGRKVPRNDGNGFGNAK